MTFGFLLVFTWVVLIAGLSWMQLFSKPVSGFSGTTGSQAWSFTTGDEVWSSPAIADVDGDGKLEIVKKLSNEGREWAVNLWEAIEEALPGVEENPLAAFSDEEILAEARRRGLIQ